MSSDPLTELSVEDRERLEGVLVEFDLRWTPDRLAAAVGQLPPAGPFREAALREMVKIDLERHARRGRPARLQDYLDRFPELGDSDVASTDLRNVEAEVHDTIRPTGAVGSVHLPKQFGRYRVIRPLGRGGMGGVYLARDSDLDRLVALKVPRFTLDDAAVERFTREAKAAATIDHPNICRVYDVGRIDGLPYISMAYIEGPTLADVLHDGPLPPRRAAQIARDVARALAEAHRRGVVHRDLKPANILMTGDSGPKTVEMSPSKNDSKLSSLTEVRCPLSPVVTDFGLSARTAPDDPRLTAEGMIAGTPPYMSPEQISGDRAGPASDVYSLGAVLYEMATGRTPFTGSRADIFSQALSAKPAMPSSIRPAIDSGLDAIALKALAKRPWDRFTGMAEFADALDGWLAGGIDKAPVRRWTGLLIGASAAAAVLVIGLVYALVRTWGEKSSQDSLADSGGSTLVAANSGTTVANTARVTPIPGKTGGTTGSAKRVSIDVKNMFRPHMRPKTVFDVTLSKPDERIVAIAFTSNGRQIVAATADKTHLGTRRWDAVTGKEETGSAKRELHQWAEFTSDSRLYLAGGGLSVTALRNTETGAVDKQFPTAKNAQTGAITRDGKRVIVGLNIRSQRRARVYDVSSGDPLGEFTGHEKDIRCVALSDDGKVAYSASPDRHAVWDAQSGKRITEAGENGVLSASFIQKHPKVIFGYSNGGIGAIDLRVGVRFDDFEDRHRDAITCLAQSPSSSYLMVAADADNALRGWEPHAGKQLWELLELPETILNVGFSPDGRRMVTASARTWTIWQLRE